MRHLHAGVAGIALLLVLSTGAEAQVVRIGGVVKDEGGRPIKGATVIAQNPEHAPATLTVSTDDKGRFGLIGMRRGAWTFTFDAPGFEPVRLTQELTSLKPNKPLEVRLAKGAAPAPPPPLSGLKASDIQARLDLAEERARAGDIDGAIDVYRDLLARVPALTSLYMQIGALRERKSDLDGALGEYRRLAEQEPDNVRARAAIARLTRK